MGRSQTTTIHRQIPLDFPQNCYVPGSLIEANDLVDFNGRHASALKYLRLESPGRWTTIGGRFGKVSIELGNCMEITPWFQVAYNEHRVVSSHQKKGIEAYLTDASIPRDTPLSGF